MKIFFYGLFMDESLLASKGIIAAEARPGFVKGHALRIGERATLVRRPDSRAYGIVMELHPGAVTELYAEASVADYQPETVTVELMDGTRVDARCYNLPADKVTGTNRKYAKSLLDVATQLGFPDSYLKEIRQAQKADASKVTEGGCLCGEVRFTVRGPLRNVVNCHCSMCQRLHGSFGPHTKARKQDITITQDHGLAWYDSSEIARRGFCRLCGSSLFWEPIAMDSTGILAGCLDGPTGLTTMGHIFVAEKPDFYDISDDLPQFAGSSQGKLPGDYK